MGGEGVAGRRRGGVVRWCVEEGRWKGGGQEVGGARRGEKEGDEKRGAGTQVVGGGDEREEEGVDTGGTPGGDCSYRAGVLY